MRQVQTRDQLWAVLRKWRRSGSRIALVPTMGNLHEGHLALVAAARECSDRVVASIYVNPAQFGEGEDYERYPRTPDEDREALEAAHCDLLFAPSDRTMYPGGLADATCLQAPRSLSAILEGAARPGHFDGVVTVVSRLFNLVGPDVAVFGEKDYQQLLVIQRLVEDMGYPIRVVSVPTVRSAAGLALSSRNRYLQDEQRGAAEQLNGILAAAARRVIESPGRWQEAEREARNSLEQSGMRVDYVAVRRAVDLDRPLPTDRDLRVLAAAWCGGTRLIDNRACRLG
jgi:pantoate--beta-alanine ligase